MEKIGKISNTTLFILAGATIYSSELLLNGIVTQKLEYDRLVQILRCKLLPLTRFQKFFFFSCHIFFGPTNGFWVFLFLISKSPQHL